MHSTLSRDHDPGAGTVSVVGAVGIGMQCTGAGLASGCFDVAVGAFEDEDGGRTRFPTGRLLLAGRRGRVFAFPALASKDKPTEIRAWLEGPWLLSR